MQLALSNGPYFVSTILGSCIEASTIFYTSLNPGYIFYQVWIFCIVDAYFYVGTGSKVTFADPPYGKIPDENGIV